jgi:hypothetical protein
MVATNQLDTFCSTDSMEMEWKHPKKCVVCGELTYSICVLCGGKGLHHFPQKGNCSSKDCFIDYHDEAFFGLALDDLGLLNKPNTRVIGPLQALQSGKAMLDTLNT